MLMTMVMASRRLVKVATITTAMAHSQCDGYESEADDDGERGHEGEGGYKGGDVSK